MAQCAQKGKHNPSFVQPGVGWCASSGAAGDAASVQPHVEDEREDALEVKAKGVIVEKGCLWYLLYP